MRRLDTCGHWLGTGLSATALVAFDAIGARQALPDVAGLLLTHALVVVTSTSVAYSCVGTVLRRWTARRDAQEDAAVRESFRVGVAWREASSVAPRRVRLVGAAHRRR